MIATETDFRNFQPPQSLPGTESHCKRVAAWCEELARALHLLAHERSALVEAALGHHQPELLFGEGFDRLLEDMGFTVDQKLDCAAVSRLSNGILRVLHKGADVHDRRAV